MGLYDAGGDMQLTSSLQNARAKTGMLGGTEMSMPACTHDHCVLIQSLSFFFNEKRKIFPREQIV